MPMSQEQAYQKYMNHLQNMNNKYKTNKEEFLERNKRYFNAHKEDIFKRQLAKLLCPDCNISISRVNMSVHKKTDKHKNNVMRLNENIIF